MYEMIILQVKIIFVYIQLYYMFKLASFRTNIKFVEIHIFCVIENLIDIL